MCCQTNEGNGEQVGRVGQVAGKGVTAVQEGGAGCEGQVDKSDHLVDRWRMAMKSSEELDKEAEWAQINTPEADIVTQICNNVSHRIWKTHL